MLDTHWCCNSQLYFIILEEEIGRYNILTVQLTSTSFALKSVPLTWIGDSTFHPVGSPVGPMSRLPSEYAIRLMGDGGSGDVMGWYATLVTSLVYICMSRATVHALQREGCNQH